MARPVLVVIDTNVAILETHLFFKKLGPELLTAMRKAGARLVLPDILRQEYIKHYVEVGQAARGQVKKGASMARPFFDQQTPDFFPSDEEIGDRARRLLESLQDVISFVPQTEELLLATSRRVMANIAPCSKTDHGFKDCLIWESVLSVADGSELHLVSKDKAFYQEGFTGRLADTIMAETQAKGITAHGHAAKSGNSLESVVKAILAHVPADDPNALNVVDANSGGTRSAPTAPPTSDDGVNQTQDQANDHAPTSGATEAMGALEQSELDSLLEPMRAEFRTLDGKVLGLIALLGGHAKEPLYALLAQMGIDLAHARNACDRLALSGLITDTGNNLLPVPGRAADVAAALVEDEVAALALTDR